LGRNRKTGKKPVNMSPTPQPALYRPPDEHLCEVVNYPVFLGDGHSLHVHQRLYRNFIVWFAIMQRFENAAGIHDVARIDCCHGMLHRHVFDRQGVDLMDQQPIATLYSGSESWATVDSHFTPMYDRMLSEYMANHRRWCQ
jgi:hypothetical protein